jgi:hypothetical protein
MPLHVDRTTIHANLAPREHVLEHHGHGSRSATATLEPPADSSGVDATLRLAQVATPGASDVENVEQAEALVRSLAAAKGGSVTAAHGALDPARVASLVSD